jgi:hypothetical protein
MPRYRSVPSTLLAEIRSRLRHDCSRGPDSHVEARIESHRASAWASATFEGSRHEFSILLEGDPDTVGLAADKFRHSVVTEEFKLNGELLADISLVDDSFVVRGEMASRCLRYEALTVRD